MLCKFFLLNKKSIIFLLFLAFFVHFSFLLFAHFTHFQPFGTGFGDYVAYDFEAKEITKGIKEGNLNFIRQEYHPYSFVVAFFYYLFGPYSLIPELFNLFLVILSIVLIFLIVKELGGKEREMFLAGLTACFYPSFLFYTSYMLKDAILIFSSLLALLLTIKLIRKFSWSKFLLFHLVAGIIVEFRIYLGYAIIFTFLSSWFLLNNLKIEKRIFYILLMIFLFGFLFYLPGNNYWGIDFLIEFLNYNTIYKYRNFVYSGEGSTFNSELFLYSFLSVVLGPFLWQMRYLRHFTAFIEVIPWYFIFFFVIISVKRNFLKNKLFLPLLVFAFLVCAVQGLYVPNFGIFMRIRIPAFLSLMCIFPFGINWENKLLKRIDNFLNKINI